jgi:hypothetical protein
VTKLEAIAADPGAEERIRARMVAMRHEVRLDDPEADARFAAFKRTLVRPIPRVVLTPKPAPVKVADHVLIRRRVQR